MRFPHPDGVFFYPCHHKLDFDISLCEISINQSKFVYRGYQNQYTAVPKPHDRICHSLVLNYCVHIDTLVCVRVSVCIY